MHLCPLGIEPRGGESRAGDRSTEQTEGGGKGQGTLHLRRSYPPGTAHRGEGGG